MSRSFACFARDGRRADGEHFRMSNLQRNPDRRAFGRRPTFFQALAVLPNRGSHRCIVRNVADGGAFLEFSEPVALPTKFSIVWEEQGIEAACEVRHTDGDSVGVCFTCENGKQISRRCASVGTQSFDEIPQRQELTLRPAHVAEPTPAKSAGSELVLKLREMRRNGSTVY